MLLDSVQRSKLDPSNDFDFYQFPRFVTHVDDSFLAQLTTLYRQRLRPNIHILDLMSSWVSHLPDDVAFERVVGHGLNQAELDRNPRLNQTWVQNLNENQILPFEAQTFDAVLNAVSVQYLQFPEKLFSEIHRVLKPDGIVIVSFSNRMFYQKAIAAWRDSSDPQRIQLVRDYFASVPGFSKPEVIVRPSQAPKLLQMMGLVSGDPFYAVVAKRQPSTP
jgi:SAM-dependent methyltransferase